MIPDDIAEAYLQEFMNSNRLIFADLMKKAIRNYSDDVIHIPVEAKVVSAKSVRIEDNITKDLVVRDGSNR